MRCECAARVAVRYKFLKEAEVKVYYRVCQINTPYGETFIFPIIYCGFHKKVLTATWALRDR